MDLKFLQVGLRQCSRLHGIQITVNGATDDLGFKATQLNVNFTTRSRKPIRLCDNININCYMGVENCGGKSGHRIFWNALTANSRSACECAALTWTRMRALPCGTTG